MMAGGMEKPECVVLWYVGCATVAAKCVNLSLSLSRLLSCAAPSERP